MQSACIAQEERESGEFLGRGNDYGFVGAAGGAAGLFVAFLLSKFINSAGVMMPPPPGSTRGYPLIVDTVPLLYVGVFLLIAITTVIATIFPAYKASRLRIVDALGHV